MITVEKNTGRWMSGGRWSDGLHQAVEAKEGVAIERETQTLATITIQNYFRLYQKLAGMTGTAEPEAAQFYDIYKPRRLTDPATRTTTRKSSFTLPTILSAIPTRCIRSTMKVPTSCTGTLRSDSSRSKSTPFCGSGSRRATDTK